MQRQGYDYVRLDGSTPQKLRQGICDEFNSRPSIFLLLMSTVAGGLGLNLTAANKVVSNMMVSPSLIPLQSGMGTLPSVRNRWRSCKVQPGGSCSIASLTGVQGSVAACGVFVTMFLAGP